MKRRRFLTLGASVAALPMGPEVTQAQADPNPIRTIYSNDTTNLFSCLRPEQRAETEMKDELLAASIREARGVDAHFLQPGLGWVPWWKSAIYPMHEHQRWLEETHGVKGLKKFARYVLEGGDLLDVLVRTCGELDIAPFLSFRLNDGHHTRSLAEALEKGKPTSDMAKHYWENYERFRIGPDVNNWDDVVFDWAIPEVREYKFALIEEACANYDLAGLELDFLRHWVRFKPETPQELRHEITTNFVRRIREMLDRTAEARGLPRRRLCVRVPAKSEIRPEQGIELGALADAGVDMVNLSYSYFTWQDDSVARAREEAGSDLALYAEMTHCTMTGKATSGSGTQPFLRTTDNQFFTTAQMAYDQGATGVSFFNFAYYRYHVTDTIGPFHEPPFSVLSQVKDRDFLERQGPSCFLSSGRNDDILGERKLPLIAKRNHPHSLRILLPKKQPFERGGVLRFRSDEVIDDREIEVICGEIELKQTDYFEKPGDLSYAGTWEGQPKEFACFSVPAALLQEQDSFEFVFRVKRGVRVRVIYIDLFEVSQ
ncbi:MAG: hypothetical protein AAGA96_13780 [Verrucomicrobiota bacterium]